MAIFFQFQPPNFIQYQERQNRSYAKPCFSRQNFFSCLPSWSQIISLYRMSDSEESTASFHSCHESLSGVESILDLNLGSFQSQAFSNSYGSSSRSPIFPNIIRGPATLQTPFLLHSASACHFPSPIHSSNNVARIVPPSQLYFKFQISFQYSTNHLMLQLILHHFLHRNHFHIPQSSAAYCPITTLTTPHHHL